MAADSSLPPPQPSGDPSAGDQIMPGAMMALVLLLLINLMNYVDRQILSAVELPIGQEFHVTSVATGWLATAFLLAYMVFSPIFGVMADRVRRWAIVGVGVLIWSLASGGSGAVTTFGMLVAMRLLIGIGEAAYGPVAPTIISDLYPVRIRGKVLAWFYAAIPVGSALGYVIGGLFHDHWHWAFYLTLPPGILLGVWCFFMPEPQRNHLQQKPPAPRQTWSQSLLRLSLPALWAALLRTLRSAHKDYSAILAIPSYTINTVAMTAMTFALGGVAFFMPRYLQVERHLDPTHATPIFGGIVVVAGLLATLAGGIAGDALRKRFPGSYFLVSAGGMLIGFPLFLAILFTPFPACWVVMFAAVFCLFFNTGPSNTILANVTRPSVRATAFAMNIFIIHAFGDAISPPAIGWIAHRYSMKTAFTVMSLTMLIGGLLWLWGSKFLEADTAAANQPPGRARGLEVLPEQPSL